MAFPHTFWKPLSVTEVHHLFRNAPFRWGLAIGYAVEQFLGTSLREPGDIDIMIYRDDHHHLPQWLTKWAQYQPIRQEPSVPCAR